MTTVLEHQDVYLTHFTQLEKGLAGHGLAWLDKFRQEAIHRFAELGFPTTRVEEWKYTNVAPLAKVPFEPAQDGASRLTTKQLGSLSSADLGGSRLVFVNGYFTPALSSLECLAQGVKAGSLAAALQNGTDLVEEHLARYAAYEKQPFVALNTAFINDGAFVEIPKGLVVGNPIHLLFVSMPGSSPAVTHPRTLVVAGAGSQAMIVESYVGLGDGVYFNNAVTEIVAGENALIDYCRLQQEAKQAFHIATVQAHLSRSSNFISCNISLGGSLVRNDTNAVLAGEGVSAALNGLYLAHKRQHVDNHTILDHAQPHCTSHELYKGILDGQATGVFNGAIIVRKDAQKTDSIQHNKNLLLSADALINTKPQLEIFADDVKCTHGATIGQLDKDALFYLRARGIDREEARQLLIYAFARDIIDRIKIERIRAVLEELLFARLSAGRKAQEVL